MAMADQFMRAGKAAYQLLEAVGEPVMLHERQAAGFVDHGPIKAFVTAFARTDLIPGGPIEQGDFRAIFNFASWPTALQRRLGRGDRVTWRGEIYAVMNQDDATRGAAGQLGVELQLRGGAG
jgi:hypothetical protein